MRAHGRLVAGIVAHDILMLHRALERVEYAGEAARISYGYIAGEVVDKVH